MKQYINNQKQKIKNKIFKFLKIKMLGVKVNDVLPPEFIITKHGYARLIERTSIPRKEYPEMILKVWYDGTMPPLDFMSDKAKKRKTERIFKRFVYKYYNSDVYVFGIFYSRYFTEGQKHLLTIYNWNETRNTPKSFIC